MPSISYNYLIPPTWTKETYQVFIKELIKLSDKSYYNFNSKITPTNYKMLGIRVPILRSISKEISKTNIIDFLSCMNTTYFEETILKGIVISFIKDYDLFLKYFKYFLEDIDNWATCDICISSYSIIKKNKELFIKELDKLLVSKKTYYQRVGIVILLTHYIDDDNYLEYFYKSLEKQSSSEYYVNMAKAWFLSYLYIRYKDRTIEYLKNNKLDSFTQNKAISKIRDSYRVSSSEKEEILKYKK